MKSLLHIAPGFSLALEDFVTSTQGILAKKGSGKSYLASVEAEELLDAKQQIVVIDPTGAWWGLRSRIDGAAAGYAIAVFGGEHADLELEPTAGEVIANAIAEDHFSAVLDVSLLRKGEANRFVGAFLETLYRKNRSPMHLFIDEADVFAPQKPFGDEAKTLGACEDVVRRGRIKGIGCTMITQRPQVLNKNVLSQIDMLTVLRMNHPKDLGAVREWVQVHGVEDKTTKMLADLPSLPIGTAWIWAPATDVFQKAAIRKRHTFDSGRTPRAGERAVAAKVLASVDVAKLGAAIAATVERVRANDPKALRDQVVKLERELAAAKAVVRPAYTDTAEKLAARRELAKMAAQMRDLLERVYENALVAFGDAQRLTGHLEMNVHCEPEMGPAKSPIRRVMETVGAQRAQLNGARDESLGKAERLILTALAQYPDGRTKSQVAILTGYSVTGGGFNNAISSLRTKSYLASEGSKMWISDSGLIALGGYDPLPTGRELYEHWGRQLGRAEREILRVLFDAWPNVLTKERVAIDAGYKADGGGFGNALSKLRTLELIEGKAKLKASDALQGGAS